MVRKTRYTNIPVELETRIRLLQEELSRELGMNISFINAGRAAAKSLERKDAKFIKVIPPRRRSRNERLYFEP